MLDNASKSLWFDFRLLRASGIPLSDRLKMLATKELALVKVVLGRPAVIHVGSAQVSVHSISDVGTLESCVVDVYDELREAGVELHGSAVLDLGANIGQWTTALKLLYPDVHIIAVEPNPTVYEQLVRNTERLDGVTCVCTAVGEEESGSVRLYRQPLTGMSTLVPSGADSIADPVDVPLTTVDHLVSEPVEVIKIDVEGYEIEVLRGAAKLLRTAKYLIVEISLNRGRDDAMQVLAEVQKIVPGARIIKFGRPLGQRNLPTCQDVLISLRAEAA